MNTTPQNDDEPTTDSFPDNDDGDREEKERSGEERRSGVQGAGTG